VAAAGVPVIANGDARDGPSAARLMETGAAGVMVGRACLGAPWVFARVKAEWAGMAWEPPTREEIGAAFLEHHDLLAELLGPERAVRHCRKLGAFYSRGFSGAKEFRERLNRCGSREELAGMVAHLIRHSVQGSQP